MKFMERVRAAASVLSGYPKPKGPGIMPNYPDWRLLQPWSLNDVQLDVPNAVKRVATIQACVTRFADDFARLPRVFEIETKPGEYEPLERVPDGVVDIFLNANKEQTAVELLRDLGAHWKSAGNAYLVVDDFGRRAPSSDVWELWSAAPHLMEPVPGEGRRGPIAYVYNRAGQRLKIDAQNVVAFRAFNPDDSPLGASPLEAVDFQYHNRFDLHRVVREFVKSGGMAPGYWRVPEGTDATVATMALGAGQEEAILEKMKSRQGVGAWFKPFIAGILKREEAGPSFKDMMLIELLGATDADICRVLGVPPWMIGIKENTSALSGQQGPTQDAENYWQGTVQSATDLFDSVLTEKLCPRFQKGNEKVRVRTDFSGVLSLQMPRLEQADKLRLLTGRSVLTVNEARAKMGEKPVDDPSADELFVPASPFAAPTDAGTGGDAKTADPKPGAPDNAGEKAAKSLRMIDGDASREQRRKYHRVRIGQYEARFARAFKGLFDSAEDKWVRYLRERYAERRAIALGDLDVPDPDDREAIRAIFEELVKARGEEAMAQIAAEVDMLLTSVRASQWLKARTDFVLSKVTETTSEAVKLTLADGLSQQESLNELVARVRQVFDDRRGNAATIARTEAGSAYNFAATEAWAQSGIVDRLEWLSSRDDAVRESHAELDGDVVESGQKFKNGLYYPGESGGPPEEVINCRCVAEPIVNEEKRSRVAMAKWWQKVGTNGHVPTNRVKEMVA